MATFGSDAIARCDVSARTFAWAYLPATELQHVVNTLPPSFGTTIRAPFTLEAGTCLAACFFPPAGTGVPHALPGTFIAFDVTG